MELAILASTLKITKENLKYYLGRFIESDVLDDATQSALAQIVLFRKLGCTPSQVVALLSGDTTSYAEILSQNTLPSRAWALPIWKILQETELKDIRYEICLSLLQHSVMDGRVLAWDKLFWGRVHDFQNVIFGVAIALGDFIFNHNYGWNGVASSLLWGMLFALFAITANTIKDFTHFFKIRRNNNR